MDLDNIYVCTEPNCFCPLTFDGIESHIFLQHKNHLVSDSSNKENNSINKSADHALETDRVLGDPDAITQKPKLSSRPPSSRLLTFHRSKIKKFNEIRSSLASFLTSSKQLYIKEINRLETLKLTYEEDRKRQDELYQECKEKLFAEVLNFFDQFEKAIAKKRGSSDPCDHIIDRLSSEKEQVEIILNKLSDKNMSFEKKELDSVLQRFATNSFNLNQTKLFGEIDALALKLKNHQISEKIEVDESRINSITAEMAKYLKLGSKIRSATPLISKLSPVVLPATPSGLRKNLSITIESPTTIKRKTPKYFSSNFSSKQSVEVLENAFHAFEVGTHKLHAFKIELGRTKPTITAQIQELIDQEYSIPLDHRSLKTSGGDIILTGGKDTSNSSSILNRCYKLSSSGDQLEEIVPMNRERHSHGLIELAGYIYALGGVGKKGCLSHCERLSCENLNEKWEVSAELNVPSYNATFCAVNNTAIYKIGGYLKKGKVTNKVEKYSLDDNHWFMINYSYDEPKSNFFALSGAAQLDENKIIVFGGRDEKEVEQRSFYYFHINDNSAKENEESCYHLSAVYQAALPWAESFTNSQIFHRKGRLIYLSKLKQSGNVSQEGESEDQVGKFKVSVFNQGTWSSPDA